MATMMSLREENDTASFPSDMADVLEELETAHARVVSMRKPTSVRLRVDSDLNGSTVIDVPREMFQTSGLDIRTGDTVSVTMQDGAVIKVEQSSKGMHSKSARQWYDSVLDAVNGVGVEDEDELATVQ